MKLRDFDFNSIDIFPITGLSVRQGDGEWYDKGCIGDTLKALPPHFADAEIKETRWYFNTFVIELE